MNHVQRAKLDNQADYLVIHREPKKENPNQGSFIKALYLDYDKWLKGALEIAGTIHGPFWFSELRKRLLSPHHPNAFGSLAKALLKNGYRKTGEWRMSSTESRKGGLEWRFQRM